MTVESNFVIVIATFSDWLKISRQFVQGMRAKTDVDRSLAHAIFPARR